MIGALVGCALVAGRLGQTLLVGRLFVESTRWEQLARCQRNSAKPHGAILRVAPLIQVLPAVVDGDGSEAHVFAVAIFVFAFVVFLVILIAVPMTPTRTVEIAVILFGATSLSDVDDPKMGDALRLEGRL